MNDNIQILNKNGDMMSVEAIAHIQIVGENKKYLIYTLNEKVDNDLTKIYIAETIEKDATGGSVNSINENDWAALREKLVRISHKEEIADVSYLQFGDTTFNVGEAKKLAVTSVAKQAFKDAQATHTISTNQTETPVISETSSFFEMPTETVQENGQPNQNIFANPPQPVQVSQSEDLPQPEQLVEPAEEPNVPLNNPTQVESASLPVQTIPSAVYSETLEQQEKVPTTAETNEAEPVASINVEGNIQKEIISDEDALKAIGIIQDYIAQEEQQ